MADDARRAQALTAWLAGADYPGIARLLAYPDADTAKADVTAALEQRAGEQSEDLLRVGAAAMLDRLQMALWSRVQNKDTDADTATRAASLIRQIIADRRKLLDLDARPSRPARHHVQPGLTLPAT